MKTVATASRLEAFAQDYNFSDLLELKMKNFENTFSLALEIKSISVSIAGRIKEWSFYRYLEKYIRK